MISALPAIKGLIAQRWIELSELDGLSNRRRRRYLAARSETARTVETVEPKLTQAKTPVFDFSPLLSPNKVYPFSANPMKRILIATKTIALATFLLTITNSHAQTPASSPSPTPSPTPAPVAIKAGRLLDVKTGKIANNVFILIENHRIKSIGSTAPAAFG